MGSVEAAAFPATVPLRGPQDGRRPQLGSILVRDGFLSVDQLEEALETVEQTGKRLGEVVVTAGWVSWTAVAKALAEQYGLRYIDLEREQIDSAATALLAEKYARRYDALPIRFVDDHTLLVAIADPTNVVACDDLRLAFGLNVEFGVAVPPDLHVAVGRIYRAQLDIEAEAEPLPMKSDLEDISAGAASAPAIKLVNSLIAQAIDDQASDLHFEPQANQLVVRARIDGVMRHVTTIAKSLQPMVMSRLKIMAELDIAEKRAPQDGRVSIRYGGNPMDMRVAVLPTTHGEQIVMRLMNRPWGRLGLADLGMSPAAEQAFARAIRQPYGAVIACGPTGSGKTTTLYAALDQLNNNQRVLMTIEDPVEYQTPGVNQIEVNPKSGLTFARGLRTILRSDPDVLLVGEIRDEETARIAIQAAMTGHVVLTTLHTHNAASSIARLIDMRVESSLLASSITCIVAQRLARRLCLHCREAYAPTPAELIELGVDHPRDDLVLYRPKSCVQCGSTGYSGRVALYEVMPIHGKLRRLIDSGSTEEIFAAAIEEGMTTLRQDGLRLALSGISSLEEIRRVTGDRLL